MMTYLLVRMVAGMFAGAAIVGNDAVIAWLLSVLAIPALFVGLATIPLVFVALRLHFDNAARD